MIMRWWEWLFLLLITLSITEAVRAAVTTYINRNKPIAKHCVRCHKLLEEARAFTPEIDD
jgi:uncharacterized protein YpmS